MGKKGGIKRAKRKLERQGLGMLKKCPMFKRVVYMLVAVLM